MEWTPVYYIGKKNQQYGSARRRVKPGSERNGFESPSRYKDARRCIVIERINEQIYVLSAPKRTGRGESPHLVLSMKNLNSQVLNQVDGGRKA